jgi:hypothetical protein
MSNDWRGMGLPMIIASHKGEPPIHLAHKGEARALVYRLLTMIDMEIPEGVASLIYPAPPRDLPASDFAEELLRFLREWELFQ